MKLGEDLYAVVFPDGEVLNCWTSPNRLYETKGAATRVRNQFIREAEDLLKHGPFSWAPETKRKLKKMAPARQEHLDLMKSTLVKKVTIQLSE